MKNLLNWYRNNFVDITYTLNEILENDNSFWDHFTLLDLGEETQKFKQLFEDYYRYEEINFFDVDQFINEMNAIIISENDKYKLLLNNEKEAYENIFETMKSETNASGSSTSKPGKTYAGSSSRPLSKQDVINENIVDSATISEQLEESVGSSSSSSTSSITGLPKSELYANLERRYICILDLYVKEFQKLFKGDI